MTAVLAYAAAQAKAPLAPYTLTRRAPGPEDVEIDVLFCGVCHSDVHQARAEWGGGLFPMVPGHEIVGRVRRTGGAVRRFQPGQAVGVGCIVDSCRQCASCGEGLEQYCERGFVGTYNGREYSGEPTYGGYSQRIVVKQDYVLSIPQNLDLAATAPLLCAGITTWSPLRHWKVGPGQTVGVVGLGGLGHMGVKLAKALGARVVLFTTSERKRADGLRLGADEVVLSTDPVQMKAQRNRLDFILNTVAAAHDLNAFTALLRRGGTMTLVGVPEKDHPALKVGGLIFKRAALAGSLIGGIAETQEMLDFCGAHGIVSDIELIPIQAINEAYDRMVRSEVKYRFVIDLASLSG
ncbi:MAG TPA: NAD(P)-dependent alcohol dehydrogenase [Nevskiaceae bacterium]|nr:NAD(P)-dependent alcohol dehydrogenase [Nevskiaceae bacterium]